MIEINILPEELRLDQKKTAKGVELKDVIYIVPVVFGILAAVQLFLAALFIFKSVQLNIQNYNWQRLTPARKAAENLHREQAVLSLNTKAIQQFITRRVEWAQKLNRLSDYLPQGIWFNEIIADSREFTLKGSVISIQREEMNLINKFMSDLKRDKSFFADFSNIELSSVQRRVLGNSDVLDFIITGNLKLK